MIDINNKVDCSGCNACGDICPKGAITFETDREGFWYPKVDSLKCIECGLCEKACPIINADKLKQNDYHIPICYAAYNNNVEERFASASGGMYSALADKTLKAGGYVAGVVFNDDYSLRFQITNDKKEFKSQRGSKYLQANAEGFYKRVKDLLIAGEHVLVCGCPCQMAAVRSFLGKSYENLIIVDVICLGINSPKIFRKYLDSLESRYNSEIVEFRAKNKELGWERLTSKIVFKNGDVLYDVRETNKFTQGYILTHMFCRPSCYDCKFKGYPRIADITIGDFWGGKKYTPELFDNLGTSVVILNSKKGEKYFESIKNKLTFKPVTIEQIEPGNKALVDSLLASKSFNREQFYDDLNNMTFEEVTNKYIIEKKSFKLSIKNILVFCFHLLTTCRLNLSLYFRNIWHNCFDKRFHTNIKKGHYILINKNTIFNIHKTATIYVNGFVNYGSRGCYPKSHTETCLRMDAKSTLVFEGSYKFNRGGDIEVFANANLIIGDGGATNINASIICGQSIKIGAGTMFGRNVTVRDNNGGHVLSVRGYKNFRPVEIGTHCWICESSIVMAGAKLGTGVIVSGGSLVSTGNYPSFSLLSGNPAQVVDKNIYWKY